MTLATGSAKIARGIDWLLGPLVFLILAGWATFDGRLTLPPYEDQAVGYWSEADYLLDHQYDYWKLRYEESHLLDGTGGSRSYTISVLPTLVALLLEHPGSPTQTAALMRLLSFVAAAVAVYAVFHLLVGRMGWLAILPAIALATSPSFLVQAEIAGMDMPMTGSAMLGLCFLAGGYPLTAVVLMGLAFFFKPTGIVATFALLLVLGAASYAAGRNDRKYYRRAFIAAAVLMAIEAPLLLWSDIGAVTRTGFSIGQFASLAFTAMLAPEMGLLLMLTLFVGGITVFQAVKQVRIAKRLEGRGALETLGALAGQSPAFVTAWLMIAGVTVSIGKSLFVPRYLTLALPPLYLIAGLVLLKGRRRAGGIVVFSALILFQLTNLYGRWLPPIEQVASHFEAIPARSCGFLERSLEYRAYHRADVEAMKAASAQPNSILFAQFPYSYYLGRPRLGYVQRRPEYVSLDQGPGESFAAFRSELQRQLQLGRTAVPLFLWLGDRSNAVPLPEAEDEILYCDGLVSPLVIYRPNVVTEGPLTLTKWEDWYLGRLLGQLPPSSQIRLLMAVGRLNEAVTASERMLAENPEDLETQLLFADALSQLGRYREATAAADHAVITAPEDPRVWWGSAAVELRNFDYEKARDRVAEAIRLAPQWPEAYLLNAKILEKLGDHGGAKTHYQKVLELRPNDPTASSRLQVLN